MRPRVAPAVRGDVRFVARSGNAVIAVRREVEQLGHVEGGQQVDAYHTHVRSGSVDIEEAACVADRVAREVGRHPSAVFLAEGEGAVEGDEVARPGDEEVPALALRRDVRVRHGQARVVRGGHLRARRWRLAERDLTRVVVQRPGVELVNDVDYLTHGEVSEPGDAARCHVEAVVNPRGQRTGAVAREVPHEGDRVAGGQKRGGVDGRAGHGVE